MIYIALCYGLGTLGKAQGTVAIAVLNMIPAGVKGSLHLYTILYLANLLGAKWPRNPY